MAQHLDAEALREALDRALQACVIERDQTPTALAHEMVVMIPTWMRALKPRLSVPDGEALDEPVFKQQVKYPVDARASGRPATASELILDLHRRERA